MKTISVLSIVCGAFIAMAASAAQAVTLNCTNAPVPSGYIEYVLKFQSKVTQEQGWCSSGEGRFTVTSRFVGHSLSVGLAEGKMKFSSCSMKGLYYEGIALAKTQLTFADIFRASYSPEIGDEELTLHVGDGVQVAKEVQLKCSEEMP